LIRSGRLPVKFSTGLYFIPPCVSSLTMHTAPSPPSRRYDSEECRKSYNNYKISGSVIFGESYSHFSSLFPYLRFFILSFIIAFTDYASCSYLCLIFVCSLLYCFCPYSVSPFPYDAIFLSSQRFGHSRVFLIRFRSCLFHPLLISTSRALFYLFFPDMHTTSWLIYAGHHTLKPFSPATLSGYVMVLLAVIFD